MDTSSSPNTNELPHYFAAQQIWSWGQNFRIDFYLKFLDGSDRVNFKEARDRVGDLRAIVTNTMIDYETYFDV